VYSEVDNYAFFIYEHIIRDTGKPKSFKFKILPAIIAGLTCIESKLLTSESLLLAICCLLLLEVQPRKKTIKTKIIGAIFFFIELDVINNKVNNKIFNFKLTY